MYGPAAVRKRGFAGYRKSRDLPPQHDLPTGIKADEVKDVLANVDTYRRQRRDILFRSDGRGMLLLSFEGQSLFRLTRWGKQPVHPISGLGGQSGLSHLHLCME